MPRPFALIAAFTVCLLAVASALAQAPAAPQQASPIVIAPPVVELGAIEAGSTHPAKFTIINSGKTEITVVAATPNCKCTAISDVAGRKIAPGGTLELSASLAAPRAPGVKEAVVFLTFNGAPPAQAKIRGDVRLKVIAEPPYVDALKDVTSGTVKLRAADGKPFTVTRSGGRAPVFVGFDPAKDQPRAEYEIRWDLSGLACEQMPLWWFVWTDRADCAVVPLRVRDECTGSKHDQGRFSRFWIVKESLVDAGRVHNGKPGTVEVELEHYNPPKRGAVEKPEWRAVSSVRSLIPGVEVKYVSKRDVGADGAMVTLEVVAAHGGAFEGEIEIETATGKGRVPFTVFATTW
ncbi:MAG: hypothetical protein RIS45_1502 [Planctomycetota bacterium]|jgi:hypothetical protein